MVDDNASINMLVGLAGIERSTAVDSNQDMTLRV
jgi:hypothetical protein